MFNSNSLGSLSEIQNSRQRNTISREEYWGHIQRALLQIEELSVISKSNLFTLEINETGLLLKFKLGLYSKKYLGRTDSMKLYVDPADMRTAPMMIIADGKYENFQSDLLVGLCELSANFADIGANVGFYTTLASLVNPNLEIIAFEPNPSVYTTLRANLSLNESGKNVVCINSGLGDKETTENLFIPPKSGTAAGSLMNLHPEEGLQGSIPVVIQTLDANYSHIAFDLLKIDVEGFELSVLRGAGQQINNSHPTVVIELLRKWMKPFGNSPQDVVKLFSERNYICYAIERGVLTEILVIDDSTVETNFIFVHPSKSDHVEFLKSFVL